LIRVDGSGCDVVANILGDTPFTVTPCFFLRRRECNVYVDDGGLFVPAELVQPIRVRRRIVLEAEGLCFTYPEVPRDFTVTRPELVRRLVPAKAKTVGQLPSAASFLYRNYFSPEALLTEGIAFGVLYRGRLVSMAASLALTPNYCEVRVPCGESAFGKSWPFTLLKSWG